MASAPHTLVSRTVETLKGTLDLTEKQIEILLAVYELKRVPIYELATLFGVKETTMINHLVKLRDKSWLKADLEDDGEYIALTAPRAEHLRLELRQVHTKVRYLISRIAMANV